MTRDFLWELTKDVLYIIAAVCTVISTWHFLTNIPKMFEKVVDRIERNYEHSHSKKTHTLRCETCNARLKNSTPS